MHTCSAACSPARAAGCHQALAFLALLIMSMLAPAPASGQTPPPRLEEDVVVTATLTPLTVTSLGRTAWVISRDDVEQLGLGSVTAAIRLIPGLDVRARGPHEVQTDFSIRGATFGQNLVLADGLRLNDSQSGHHNGEIPLPALSIGRVEVVPGAGSAVHGADALGGTINVLTRRDRHRAASLTLGEHGLVDAQASASIAPLPEGWVTAGWFSRSSGFMFDREFTRGGAVVRGPVAAGWRLDVRHQRRAFGANGFYGPSPSKEWTDQTITAVGWQADVSGWTADVQALYRNHGDHFLWDIARPGFAENFHRTHATEIRGVLSTTTETHGTLSVGADAGGDWVRSSNLGDHEYGRGSLFAEWLRPFGEMTTLQSGLRFDHYSAAGGALSPTIAIVRTLTPALRLRASAGRAFRVPSFTERYYSDPRSLGRSDLSPERGWTLDGGVDGNWTDGWAASTSVFRRWDEDVIDWVQHEPDARFRATNIRDVTTTGFEVSVSRRWAAALAEFHVTGLTVDAPELALPSRYLLEYARRQIGGSLTLPVFRDVRAAVTVDHRNRVDGQSYALVGARASWERGGLGLFLEASNLFDETYEEIAGVAMPGRWVSAGVTIR